MRSVSAIAADETPRSAAFAKSVRTMTSGRTRLELEVTAPMPGRPRRSRSTFCACSVSTRPSSPVSANTYFSLEPPMPILTRAPGTSSIRRRRSPSTACLLMPGRSLRSVRLIVSVDLVTSDDEDGSNGSLPDAPPPIVV